MTLDSLKRKFLHHRFERQARATPEATAVIAGRERCSFDELNGRANQLARLLKQQGVGPESFVAVCLERSIEMVTALLAVLKAGAAYLPVDPDYPAERMALMLTEAETAVCLTHSQLVEKLPESARRSAILLDQSAYVLSLFPANNLAVPLQPENLAYLIFTSGSTGRPKGAMITHGGLANYLDWAVNFYPVEAGGAPVHSSIGFDLTVTSLYLPLLVGQTVTMLPQAEGGAVLGEALARDPHFGLVKITPAHLQLLDQMVPVDRAADATYAFVIGGEQLTQDQVAFWRRHAPHTRLFNEYGPTETVVGCCVYEVLPHDNMHGVVPIGKPIAKTQLYVLDEQIRPVPAGETGELYIGGAGVARGYLKRPSLTAERFVPDPFSGVPGARLYRTGDRVRLRPDGNLEFVGRIDNQVKLHGYRIELGEIESVLGSHPAVRQPLVLVREDPLGEKRLVAYLITQQQQIIADSELKAFLQPKLPAYMIPSAFVLLDAFPLTTNGKIDRRALPLPEPTPLELERPYSPPRTTMEQILAEIWGRVLNVARVGIKDKFFELGGDSIRSIQMLAQARQAGFHFSLSDLFELQTIARLSEKISHIEEGKQVADGQPLAPFGLLNDADRAKLPPAVEDAYPVGSLQAGMLFHTELDPDTAVYHNVTSRLIEGVFDEQKLVTAVQRLAEQHPILRTSFDLHGYSEPLQLVWSAVDIPVTCRDLAHLNGQEQTQEMARLVEQAVVEKFDWAKPPLLRFHFIRLSQTHFQMILVDHHAILDGWSVAAMVTELCQTYATLLARRPISPVETVPYSHYIAAERASLNSDATRAFWQELLLDAGYCRVPRLPLPVSESELPETVVHRLTIPPNDLARLNRVAKLAEVPLKSVLLAAHKKVLGFVTGQKDVLSGLVMNGRLEDNGADRSLGLFLNTLPFRQKLGPGSWLTLIQESFAIEKAMLPHRRLPLLEIQQMHGGQPLFEVAFNFLHYHVYEELAEASIRLLDEQFLGHASFALAVEAELNPTSQAMELRLEYKPAEFSAAQIERLAGYYARTLAAMAADPNAAHQQFSPLSAAERQQLLVEWNDTAEPIPEQLIHEWIAAVAVEMPEKTAVSYGEQQLTYGQLNQKVNQLAHYLKAQGVGPETIVGMFLNRCPEMVIAVLAILKAGGVYLPLDPAYPVARLHYLLEDAQVNFVLTTENVMAAIDADQLRLPAANIICLDREWPHIAGFSGQNPAVQIAAEQAAYLIYTSGSTGRPKGVIVTHRGIPNMAQAKHKIFAVNAESRVLQFASLGFDASVSELFVTLAAGATLVLAPAETLLPGPELADLVNKELVTAVTLPPSVLAILSPDDFPSLKTVVAAGESCPISVIHRWAMGRRFVNGYGPTEATVCATAAVLTGGETSTHIGRPISNVHLYVLDEDGQPAPIGTPGELYIGGPGVARGYLNRPALTAERFVADPFPRLPGTTSGDIPAQAAVGRSPCLFYRSGDRVRYLPDGNIEFLGRLDYQVKLRGFRIEPGEIEAMLRRLTAVQDALVLARDDSGSGPQLVAYVVGNELVPEDLRSALSDTLPAYMLPAAFVPLDAFPLTPNNKIDRRALPAPAVSVGTAYEPPRNDVETVLATIWADVLKLPRVGIHDNFFELGGHSLLATQLVVRLRSTLRIKLPLRALFDSPTVACLSEMICTPPNDRGQVEKVARLLIKLSQLSAEEAAQLLSQKQ